MNVLAVNGSPRKGTNSCTHLILEPFLEGMKSAGARTELVSLADHTVNPCLGCFACWVKTPGECVRKDDMAALLPKYAEAELVVFATPLYHYSMSGLLKNFIDRTLPLAQPWIVEDTSTPGLSAHPSRFPMERSIFLVSPCGFPEFGHFGQLVAYFKFVSSKEHWKYVGEILRPAAEALKAGASGKVFGWYFDLVRQAGEQVVRDGAVSEALRKELQRDLFPGGSEVFRQQANRHWMEELERFGNDPTPPPEARLTR